MAFSAKQVQALRRQPDRSHIRTREAHGRELTYLEGWYAISQANRIFGFDGWSRETVESRCVLARENRGSFLAVYIARVRLTVQADGVTIIREGHGTGEGRGASPGEVHDVALKAAETDATKRALATFGKPFGLELYRGGRAQASQKPLPSPAIPVPADARLGFHPDDTTPIPRPSTYYGRRQGPSAAEHLRQAQRRPANPNPRSEPAAPPLAPDAAPSALPATGALACGPHRQEPACPRRTQTPARQGASEVRCLSALPCLRAAAVRSAPPALCPAPRHRHEGERRVHRPPLPRPSPAAASGGQRGRLVGGSRH